MAYIVLKDFNTIRNVASWAFRRRMEGLLCKSKAFKILMCALRELQHNSAFRNAIVRRQRTRNRVHVDWQMYYGKLFATSKKPNITTKMKDELKKLINGRKSLLILRRRYAYGGFKVIYDYFNRIQ